MSRLYRPTALLRPSVRIFSKTTPPVRSQPLSTVRQINGPLTPEILKKEDVDITKPFVVRSRLDGDGDGDGDGAHNTSISKWFSERERNNNSFPKFSDYLNDHLDLILPYELILPSKTEYEINPNNPVKRFISWLSDKSRALNPHFPSLSVLLEHEIAHLGLIVNPNNNNNNNNNNINPSNDKEGEAKNVRFLRFDAPLALLSAGLEYNSRCCPEEIPLTQLYIAQAPISNLPPVLKADLGGGPSSILSCLGRGDIYNSSIWLGLEPTYTPWHRDPNPNLFVQLRGRKAVRLMPPNRGRNLYERVQAELKQTPSSWRIRGEEMMQGAERNALFKAVWDPSSPGTGLSQAVLGPCDVMYLPKGWWHSVRSEGAQAFAGGLNASVNWWFR
ncbi:hypothetical protein QBC43DRAFT_48859 [Cladorrhinum sp. PSN259]|nr:hypothetical protein QBC43DRAFT_48859 [Cladorrhinum sp. PSN259]